MILTLNPETKTTTIISIQRDTMTNIINSKKEVLSTQKMNAAYPLGYNENGLETAVSYAMNTISEQSGISIDNFVAMNMDGLVNLVDDVGGIDVINDSGGDIFISNTEPQYTAVVPFIGEGKSQHINGEQALVFSRDRDHLPNGDYGRSAHQREVLQALMKKMLNLNSITTYQKFIKSISNDFKTDISVDVKNLMSLMSYKDCFNKVVSIQYEGVGKMVDDASGNEISYQFIPNNVYLSIQNVLRKSINETKIQSLSSNIITYENECGVSPDLYYLPSAVIREGGKSTEYGINPDGDFISIDEANKQEYIMSKDS
ncbi:LCP family protein [Lactococcus sp. DD01]|nr:LCP family protein [Lactococcus sp. DD01]